MSFYILTYFIIGLILLVFYENTIPDIEEKIYGSSYNLLSILQRIAHYIRFVLTWPLYLVEDFIIVMRYAISKSNEGKENE